MNLKNCPSCGKIYLENPSKLCPACYAEEETSETTIKEYLQKTGKATINQIHKATNISEKIIKKMLASGRLTTNGQIGYPCQMCQTAIYEKNLCETCANKLTIQAEKIAENKKNQPEQKPYKLKMHTKK